MSQPPPPPGNPPQFGKSDGAVPPLPPQGPPPAQGAPQPPPAGYGYPAQAPPPAPGPAATPPPGGENPYATPVPPGQNPYASAPTQAAFPPGQFPQQTPPPYAGGPQQNGYGYPAQGSPYGQPGQPGQQPYGRTPPPQNPYGYGQTPPPQALFGYAQQPPPPGRSNKKLVTIVAAAVAAVLVVGGGVYFATKGGDGDRKPAPQASSEGPSGGPTTATSHSSELSFKWDKDADPVADKDNLKDALGIWFTDKYAVKNEIDQVVGYDLATGAPAWTVAAPSKGDCTAARDSSDHHIAAIQYGATCEKIMAIDLDAGRALWSATLPGSTGDKGDFDYSEMAISGDTVGVDWLEGSIGYRLTDQKVLWRSGNGDCEDDGYAGGAQFVAVVNCDYKSYKVQVLDPAKNGSPKWSWTAPTGTEVNAIVSTDPVVVILGTEDETYTDVATVVDGRLQSRVSLGTKKYDIDDDGTEKQSVHNVLVDKDTLYLTLAAEPGGDGKVVGGIAAFNLGDGKQKWIAKPGGDREITGLGFEDGKVLAYERPGYDVAGRLVTLDPATGAITTYATFAKDAYDRLESGGLHDYAVWHDDRFYYVTKTIYSSVDDQMYVQVYG
ncbi:MULTISPECIES: outer membrane protein assembly factor BamB family protein [unclassified Streptomyces]|uniref:outer membrane protein assembly factor BamB family protein n=1 Tax=unclassified Streptomyces TaxID=2593676 RepID=UPI002E282CF8|nr:PQQ-binding-like beta-propeller repeat protein [Streptomyces sp. NBC_00223]